MQNAAILSPSSGKDLRSDYERALDEQIAQRRKIVQQQLDESGQPARTDLAGALRRAEKMR